jgi:hypothetical protein
VSTRVTRYRKVTYETEFICPWIVLDILRQVFTRNPIRDELEGGSRDSDTQEGDDVRVFQVFPCYSLFVEALWVFTVLVNGLK